MLRYPDQSLNMYKKNFPHLTVNCGNASNWEDSYDSMQLYNSNKSLSEENSFDSTQMDMTKDFLPPRLARNKCI